MAKQRLESPRRKMKPVFLVFCEGETEETYLDHLKQAYRSPIKIIPKVEGGDISQRLIDARRRELKISKNDKVLVFLMYDMDVPEVNARLERCRAFKLLSNPSIELWFLLHGKGCVSNITTDEAFDELVKLENCWNEYEKAALTETQKSYLWNNRLAAVERARKLQKFCNPSSGVYNLSCTKDAYRNILYAERPSHAQFLSGKTTVDSSSGYAELCAPETASV